LSRKKGGVKAAPGPASSHRYGRAATCDKGRKRKISHVKLLDNHGGEAP